MRINTNLAALNAWRSLTFNNAGMTRSLEKLSSGFRVNRAADDAAGLAVSEKMRAQIRGLNMAVRNAQDGVSMIQTAEGGAQKIQDMLQRMRELAVQANSGTLSSGDRDLLDKEFQQLITEIDRTASSTKFNNITLISSSNSAAAIQVGPGTSTTDDQVTVAFNNTKLDKTSLGIGSLDIKNTTNATASITALDTALNSVNTYRADFGAYQNRLENAISTLQTQVENLTAAESRIRDVDMAQEMAVFTKFQILQQASTAMLAQANQSTQSIMGLLR
ncbi:MAG: flagellin [Bacillota bacterium]